MIMSKPITGRTVLYTMFGFFAVIFAVNGAFLYFALSSFPGLSTERAYQKGVSYNQTLAKAEKQNAMGWVSYVSLSAQGEVAVELVDRDGSGVSGVGVTTMLRRPAQSQLDQDVALNETKPGHFSGAFSSLLAGQWHVQVSANQGGQAVFYKVHTVMVDG